MTTQYQELLKEKQLVYKPVGKIITDEVNPLSFMFQRDITKWAIRKGRCAIFADCGLGKTVMQLEWARLMGEKTLITAPLSVARQTVRINQELGLNVDIKYNRTGKDLDSQITITNYEMLDNFNPDEFGAIVADESGILKSLDGKTKDRMIEMFVKTPYRLCCSATPAPNDIAEIANHAEFLGIMNRTNMLATFFVHDDEGWRMKGHAVKPFYKWMASWSMSLRKPSELGYDDNGFILPELSIIPVIIDTEYQPEGKLFFTGLKGITDRTQVRKATVKSRVEATANLINNSNEQWIAWCGLNDESKSLTKLIPDAIEVEGSQSPDFKAQALEDFQDGKHRVLITKGKVAGFGMNFQNAHNMVFVGMGDSYELYYQCIRREYRFGQKYPVKAYIVLSDVEEPVFQNVLSKEKEADKMSQELIANIELFEKEELGEIKEQWNYNTETIKNDRYTLMLGDSVERMKEIPENSIDLSVFSPPFLSLYSYSPTERDIGNSATTELFYRHFGFIIDELLRVTKIGRNVCCHVSQVPAMLVRDGYIGLKDFRGMTIVEFEKRGFIYHGEVCIAKNPQSQSIRTHSKALAFQQIKKDTSWLRPALADYILVFRKSGDNEVPILPDISNDDWIIWANPVWFDIRESETLNTSEARSEEDEKHICALQLSVIERCIRLWSNKGETIFSPFAGIGSEIYQAIKLGRKGIGIELNPNYFKTMVKNVKLAESERQRDMFGDISNAGVEVSKTLDRVS